MSTSTDPTTAPSTKPRRAAYDSDLTDAQWERIRPFVIKQTHMGRPRENDTRELVNGILYIVRTGAQWKMMPHDLPPWSTVYYHFRRWTDLGVWSKVLAALNKEVRAKDEREPTPSAACVDSQSASTTNGGLEVGYDGNKKVKGRKRHILTDTLGLLLAVLITAANAHDGPRLLPVLHQAQATHDGLPRLQVIFADLAYGSDKDIEILSNQHGIGLELSAKNPDANGFEPIPKRWVVERTFAWLGNRRRLTKDHERLPETADAMVRLAGIGIALKKLSTSTQTTSTG